MIEELLQFFAPGVEVELVNVGGTGRLSLKLGDSECDIIAVPCYGGETVLSVWIDDRECELLNGIWEICHER
jgi:hypothetical protein